MQPSKAFTTLQALGVSLVLHNASSLPKRDGPGKQVISKAGTERPAETLMIRGPSSLTYPWLSKVLSSNEIG